MAKNNPIIFRNKDLAVIRQPQSYKIPFECWKQEEKPEYVVEISDDNGIRVFHKVKVVAEPFGRQWLLANMLSTSAWENYEDITDTINEK